LIAGSALDVTSRSLVNRHKCFNVKYFLHLQAGGTNLRRVKRYVIYGREAEYEDETNKYISTFKIILYIILNTQ
jgi:hypothetical protein